MPLNACRMLQVAVSLVAVLLVVAVQTAMAADVPARGARVMVVCAEPHAAAAAVQVLREGGTAADAAITAAVVLAVTEPYASGLGGGGFVVGYDRAARAAYALDARETAPAAAHRGMFLGPDGEVVPELSRTGALSVAVPGLVRGLWQLHEAHGRLPWARLFEPAIVLAREGFPAQEMLVQRLAEELAAGRLDTTLMAVFAPDGRLPAAGQTVRQPELAATLARLAHAGPDDFYTGQTAAAIVSAVTSRGGLVTLADLAAYRPVWREPIRGAYRGRTVLSMPPPSSGGVHLAQMLGVLDGVDLATSGYGSAATWHTLLEVMKFAYRDRSQHLGDPDHTPVALDWLLSPARLDSLRACLDPGRVVPAPAGPGAPLPVGPDREPQHTSHLSIVDAAGNAVAATLTINLSFGAGLIAEGTGVILNDQMDDFAAAVGAPNAFGLLQGEANTVAPGRRPLSSMTPTLVLEGDDVRIVAGSPGGARIITATLQAIVHVLDFGMDARHAVTVPRAHHQWSPDCSWFEPFGLSPETRRELERRGHTLCERNTVGNVQLIVRDRETGAWTGASDPRGMGLAIGF